MSLATVGASVGLGRLAAQRVRADVAFLLGLWLVISAATTLVAAALQYSDSVAISGLGRAVLNAAPADRGISVQANVTADQEAAFNGTVTGILTTALGPAAPVILAARSTALAPLGLASDQAQHRLTVLGSYTGLDQHAQLTAGSWPIAGRDPIEATVSTAAAQAMGLRIGDKLALVDASVPSSGSNPLLTVVISGTWTTNPDDTYWLGDPLDLDGVLDQGSIAYQGPLMVAPEDLLSRGLIHHLTLTWRAGLSAAVLAPSDLPRLEAAIPGLAPSLAAALPPHQPINVTLGAGPILAGVQQSLTLAQGGVTLLVLQFVVLAGFAVILVAALLGERRRRENRILESRGATRFQIIAVTIGEAILVTLPAVVVAPLIAALVIHLLATGGPLAAAGVDLPFAISTRAVIGAVVAGLVAAFVLFAPTLSIGSRLATLRLAVGREGSQVAVQRFGIDLALLLVAGLALWQLRLYGSPVTRSGGALGVDPLLVAGPAIGLAACSLLATRALPRVAHLAERVLVRRPNLVPGLGAHDLARRPLRSIRSTLLVMLAAGLTTFAVVYDATWFRSQSDQAAYQAAADLRVTMAPYSKIPAAILGPSYRAIPGVTAASPTIRTTLDIGGTLRSADLLGVDAVRMPAQADIPGGASGPLGTAIAALAGDRPNVPAVALPGRPLRLQVNVDADLTSKAVDGFGLPAGQVVPAPQGVSVSAVILDGDGGIVRFSSSNEVAFSAANASLEIPLTIDASAAGTIGIVDQLTAPLRLESLEVQLTPANFVTQTTGSLAIRQVQASDAATGDAWTDVPFNAAAPGWSWLRSDDQSQGTYVPPAGQPNLIDATEDDPIQVFFEQSSTTFRAAAAPADALVVDAIASPSFMAATGDHVGDPISGSIMGNPIQLRIVDVADGVPPLDPTKPFIVADGPTLNLADYYGSGSTLPASEWWLSVGPGQAASVDRKLSAAPFAAAAIVSHDQLLQTLQADPVALGVVGALLLGAISAVIFAALGFLVSASASIESRADEFGLLRALGLTDGQLIRWLAVEQGLLLALGVAMGIGLGVAFGWVVLPAASFTPTGARPVPEAALVVPLQVLAAMAVGSLGLLIATMIVARRIIGRISVA
ncbi:MAG: FtsX-like permease family protein, partial [Candidatus Limnocylindrales bacterium]